MNNNLRAFLLIGYCLIAVIASASDIITMDIQTYDFVQGELVLGARDLFKLIITNNGPTEVELAIGGNNFYYDSPYWSVTLNGPIDPKCVSPKSTEHVGLAHAPIKLSVLPGQNKYYCPAGTKIGLPGSYSISIEYDGTSAPDGCYQGRLRTPARNYTIKPMTGADEEIYLLWKKQNPDKSICFFPVGMQPDVMKPEELIQNYPTSTLAGWALPNVAYGAHLIGTTGRWLMEDLMKPWEERDIENKGTSFRDSNGKLQWDTSDLQATRYIQAAERFLTSHPDHVNAGMIYARLALAYIIQHRWQDAYIASKKSTSMKWEEWKYSDYLPRRDIERGLIMDIKDELVKRGLAKEEVN